MYRVSSDIRCYESCDLIYHALLQLMGKHENRLESISVTEISRESTVSRGTFYRHFDQVIDVLIWKSDCKIEESCTRSLLMKDNYAFVLRFFTYWFHQTAFLDCLVQCSRLDLLLSSLEKEIATCSPLIFRGTHLSRTREQYLVGIWSAIIWSILCTWVNNDRKEMPQELSQIAIHNLPDLHRQDIGSLLDDTIPVLHGELKFVAREEDVAYYHELGCEDISWRDAPAEIRDNCDACRNRDSCAPHPMRYLKA